MSTKYSNEDGSIRMTGPELLKELERMYTRHAALMAEHQFLKNRQQPPTLVSAQMSLRDYFAAKAMAA